MFVAPLLRPTKVVIINSPQTDYNLRTGAGSPSYPLNVICVINAAVTGTTTTTPAFRTGSGWTAGSWILIKNQNNISGYAATNLDYGVPGSGGAGGNGANDSSSSTAGSIGGAGLTGLIGKAGGPALLADSATNVRILFDNQNGSIVGGAGGQANGGYGGGGGGGGGSSATTTNY